jgi:hypothetical protein
MKGISLVAIMLLQLVILHEGIRLSNANVLVKSGKNNRKWPGKSNNGCPVNPKVEAMKKLLADLAKKSSQSQRYVSYSQAMLLKFTSKLNETLSFVKYGHFTLRFTINSKNKHTITIQCPQYTIA